MIGGEQLKIVHKIPVLGLIVLSTFVLLSCQKEPEYVLDVRDVEHDFEGTGTLFIWAILQHDEELASSFLSDETRILITQYCSENTVLGCFSNVDYESWGKIESLFYRPQYSTESTAVYQIVFNKLDPAIWFVVDMVPVDGEWRVTNWRGLVPGIGDPPSGLVDGSYAPNALSTELP